MSKPLFPTNHDNMARFRRNLRYGSEVILIQDTGSPLGHAGMEHVPHGRKDRIPERRVLVAEVQFPHETVLVLSVGLGFGIDGDRRGEKLVFFLGPGGGRSGSSSRRFTDLRTFTHL